VSRSSPDTIRNWLKALGALTAGNLPASEVKGKLDAMVPMLAMEYQAEAFTPLSLAAVARECEFFPTYATLTKHLSAWWKEHRPPPSQRAIETERQGYLPPEQRKAKQERETREARESWQNITAEEVRRKIRALDGHPMRIVLGKILHTGLARHAAQHIGLLPPEFFPNDNSPGTVVPFPEVPA